MKKQVKGKDNNIEKSEKVEKRNSWLFGIISIIIIFIIIILSLFISSKKMIVEEYSVNHWWELYDNSLSRIISNMEDITVPNDSFYWWELKDFDIDDLEYKQVLNRVVADIRVCYMEFTNEGENYSKSNQLLNYRDKSKISLDDLDNLRNSIDEATCFKRMNDYENLLISEDKTIREEFLDNLKFLDIIENNYLFTVEKPTFEEMVERKYVEVSLVEDLSAWLKQEYYKLK